jgi:anion-transporting  ArsA/GET3 family ATPase
MRECLALSSVKILGTSVAVVQRWVSRYRRKAEHQIVVIDTATTVQTLLLLDSN